MKKIFLLILIICVSLILFACENDGDEKGYNISFETNGGQEIEDYSAESIDEFPKTEKEGYFLEGWYLSQDFSGNAISFPYEVMQDTTVYARWITEEEGSPFLDYELQDEENTYIIKGYNGFSHNIIIPSSYKEKAVTEISDGAFNACETVEKIVIPDSMETIGRAFYRCSLLKEITVNENNSKFKSENGILYTEDDKKLISYPPAKQDTSYTIPESIKSVEDSAIRNCFYIKNISVSKNVDSIEKFFQNCSNLESINIDEDNSFYKSINGVLYSKDEKTLLKYPEKYNKKSFVIPDNVEDIDEYAFDRSNVESITISKAVKTFINIANCKDLKEIQVDEENEFYKSIDGVLFSKDEETLIQYPQGRKGNKYSVEEDDKEYYSYHIPNSVKTLASHSFISCNYLNKIIIPSDLKNISQYAFNNLDGSFELKEIVFEKESELQKIEAFAFIDCVPYIELTAITPPQLNDYAFNGANGDFSVLVPANTIELYEESVWNEKVEILEGDMEKTYTVDFHTNGGTDINDTETVYLPEEQKPSKNNYVFGGWYDNDSFNGQSIDFPFAVRKDINLYAKWYESTEGTDGLNYKLNKDNTYRVSSYDGATQKVEVPSTYNEKLVTRIGNSAFAGQTHITEVLLPEPVKRIGERAFAGDSNEVMRLRKITFTGEELQTIGDYAFQFCQKIENIDLPESIESIGNGAFYHASLLKGISLPEKVNQMGSYVFSECKSLSAINVNTSNKNYSSVDGVLFDKEREKLIKYPQAKLSDSYSLPDSIQEIASEGFYGSSNLQTVNFPNGLTEIGTRAFYYCNELKQVSIPGSLTQFNPSVFRNSKIEDITLSSDVSEIEDNFNGLYYLQNIFVDNANENYKSINGTLYTKDGKTLLRYPIGKRGKFTLPNNTEKIEKRAFSDCVIEEVIFNNNLVSISDEAFYQNKNLTEVTLSENIESIGDNAFIHCNNLSSVLLTSIDKYPDIGSYCFAGTDSSFSIYAPEGIIDSLSSEESWKDYELINNTYVKDGYHLMLKDDYYKLLKVVKNEKDIVIPDYINEKPIREISRNAFSSKVIKVTLPDTITTIDNFAFTSNMDSSLSTVVFEEQSQLETIGTNAFYDCRKLSNLVLSSSSSIFDMLAIEELSSQLKIFVPDVDDFSDSIINTGNLFNKNTISDNFAIEENEDGIIIKSYLGADTEIVIPSEMNQKSVVRIDKNIISPVIRKVVVLNSVTRIADEAFSSKVYRNDFYDTEMALSNIEFEGQNLTDIGKRAFQGLNIEEINLPEGLQNISASAFNSCNNLKSISIDESNDKFASTDGVLYNKNKTEIIKYPAGSERIEFIISDSVQVIGECAFENATKLIKISFNQELQEIENNAFNNCHNIMDTDLPSGLLRLESFAFKGCIRLSELFLPDSVETFDGSVIVDCEKMSILNASGQNDYFSDNNGVLFDDTGERLISYPSAKNGSYTIPENVKYIEPYAFYGSKITSIDIPENVTGIGKYAFAKSSELININIGGGTNELPEGMLKDCIKLENIEFSEVVESLGESFAENCYELNSIVIPENVTNIEKKAFADCIRMNSAVISSDLQHLGEETFADCAGLTDIHLPNVIYDAGENILKGSDSLVNINMGTYYTLNDLFGDLYNKLPSSLKNITLNEGVGVVPENFFSFYDKIETVTLPNTLEIIQKNAFSECLSLKSIDIEGVSALEKIEENSFWNCKNLVSFKILHRSPSDIELDNTAFSGNYDGKNQTLKDLIVYVPHECVNDYEASWGVNAEARS